MGATPGVPAYEYYTKVYDGIVSVLNKDHPQIAITALCLAQGGDKTAAGANIFADDWFNYFFNSSNHQAGIKPPDFVTYHFYAIPGSLPSVDPWPSLSQKTPVSQWPVHLFTQAAQFIKRAQHVNALVAAGSFGGSAVKINVDEVGIIGGKHCKIATLSRFVALSVSRNPTVVT